MVTSPKVSLISFNYFKDSRSENYNLIPIKSIGTNTIIQEIAKDENSISFFRPIERYKKLGAEYQMCIGEKVDMIFVNLDNSDCGVVWGKDTSSINIYKKLGSARIVIITIDVDMGYEMNFLELLKIGFYNELIEMVAV